MGYKGKNWCTTTTHKEMSTMKQYYQLQDRAYLDLFPTFQHNQDWQLRNIGIESYKILIQSLYFSWYTKVFSLRPFDLAEGYLFNWLNSNTHNIIYWLRMCFFAVPRMGPGSGRRKSPRRLPDFPGRNGSYEDRELSANSFIKQELIGRWNFKTHILNLYCKLYFYNWKAEKPIDFKNFRFYQRKCNIDQLFLR